MIHAVFLSTYFYIVFFKRNILIFMKIKNKNIFRAVAITAFVMFLFVSPSCKKDNGISPAPANIN